MPGAPRRAAAQLHPPLTLAGAFEFTAAAALSDCELGPVGLELETHLVDLAAPARRVDWQRVEFARDAAAEIVESASVTVEPGGQIELSGPPADDVQSAIALIRHDVQRARLRFADLGLGLAHLGADPLRPARRVNPRPRYAAMEQHFAATGKAAAGAAMMNSTAALQVNLQAGPAGSWAARVAQAHRLGPAMIALSSCSPWLAGQDTGWKSARQRTWGELEAGPLPASGDPAQDWATYALQAPVAFVCGPDGAASAVRGTVSFADWVRGVTRLAERTPTVDDLQSHLTTLFPPVRLRGYLEVRYLDMSPPRWWPAVAAVLTTLMDDPVASQAAAEACEGVQHRWTEAAREGLADPELAEAARRCVAIAAARVPAELAMTVNDLFELVDSGRCPGDLLADRIAEIGPLAAWEEVARA